jgi:hypothetical protein
VTGFRFHFVSGKRTDYGNCTIEYERGFVVVNDYQKRHLSINVSLLNRIEHYGSAEHLPSDFAPSALF